MSIAFPLAIISVCVYMFLRTVLAVVYSYRNARRIYNYNQHLIWNDWPNYLRKKKDYPNAFEELAQGLIDIRKWTFKQFYPEWSEK